MIPALIVRDGGYFERVKYDSSVNKLVYGNNHVDPKCLHHFGSEIVRVQQDKDMKSSLQKKYFDKALDIAQKCTADFVEVKKEPSVRDVTGTPDNTIEEMISLYVT
ncbi:hypothetical protein ISS05_04155 [Candidatus Woesearchaeota archaeon]|nr:hypothetical protein [Candidatus Woesearchaeota archaeon]